jgi:hypothetical protein
MNSQILHYREFEAKIRLEFYEWMDKYHSLKQKESLMNEAKEGKVSRKDMLLKAKADNTLTKLGFVELDLIDREEAIQANYNRNILQITQRREKRIREAEEEFERATSYYTNERDSSMSKSKRDFDAKKRILAIRGDAIEAERSMVIKTAAEITLERQKYDVLKSMNSVIIRWRMSKTQCPPGTRFDGPDLTLPEPLPGSKPPSPSVSTSVTPPPETQPPRQEAVSQPMGKYGMPLWVENMGETNLVLREQALREDAEARREAEQEENERKAEALARRQQYEAEVAEARKRNEENRKKKSSGE